MSGILFGVCCPQAKGSLDTQGSFCVYSRHRAIVSDVLGYMFSIADTLRDIAAHKHFQRDGICHVYVVISLHEKCAEDNKLFCFF